MQNPSDDGPVKQSIHQRSMEEKTEAAMVLLRSLNSLQEKADEDGFGFLSYLLRMAVLEAQAIASSSTGEQDRALYDADDSTFKAGSPDDSSRPIYENGC